MAPDWRLASPGSPNWRKCKLKNPLAILADNYHTRNSDLRVDGTGKVTMKKTKQKLLTSGPTITVKGKRELTLADVGALVMREADETIRAQIQDTILHIGEGVAGRIHYWEGQIEAAKFMLQEFQRKRAAIEAGEFQVNRHTGAVTFNDESLEKLA